MARVFSLSLIIRPPALVEQTLATRDLHRALKVQSILRMLLLPFESCPLRSYEGARSDRSWFYVLRKRSLIRIRACLHRDDSAACKSYARCLASETYKYRLGLGLGLPLFNYKCFTSSLKDTEETPNVCCFSALFSPIRKHAKVSCMPARPCWCR